MKNLLLAVACLCSAAAPAAATVVTELDKGKPQYIPWNGTGYYAKDFRDYDTHVFGDDNNIRAYAYTYQHYWGYEGTYSFGEDRPDWNYVPVFGVQNGGLSTLMLDFYKPVSGVLMNLGWKAGTDATLKAFDNHGHLLETLVLAADGVDQVAFGGDYGFSFDSAIIDRIEFTGNNRLAMRNILTLSAVPETASWVMMIGGFAAIGAALRRRQPAGLTPADYRA